MQVCTDLYSSAVSSSLPADETVSLLMEVLYELPDLGDALLRAVGLTSLRLVTFISCLHHCLNELQDSAATSRTGCCQPENARQLAAATRFYRLLALFDVRPEDMVLKKTELHRMWLRIANVLSSGGTCALDRTVVVSCLLAHESQSVCRWVFKMLDNADLRSLFISDAATQLTAIESLPTASSSTLSANSPGPEQALSGDSTGSGTNEETVFIDNTSLTPSASNKTEVFSDLCADVSSDIVQFVIMSSSVSHHVAWYHLYLFCFERKKHFLDLFLVSDV